MTLNRLIKDGATVRQALEPTGKPGRPVPVYKLGSRSQRRLFDRDTEALERHLIDRRINRQIEHDRMRQVQQAMANDPIPEHVIDDAGNKILVVMEEAEGLYDYASLDGVDLLQKELPLA